MDKIALMLANYFHDLAVALLASNVLVVHLVGRFLDGRVGGVQRGFDFIQSLRSAEPP